MALIPDNILSSVMSANTATGQIFTNVEQAIQNVGSIWDTITGKADAVTPAPAPVTAPAPTPVQASAQAEVPAGSDTTKYALIGLGVLAVLGIFVLRK